MVRTAVSSTNISSIGYDEESFSLEIEFNNGSVYQYFDVPPEVYRDLMAAGSYGQYFAKNIKGVFRYSRV